MLSHIFRTRRKALAALYVLGALFGLGHLALGAYVGISSSQFYMIYFLIGCSGGAWPLMNMVFAEQFGTSIRATSAIVFVNLVGGFSIPIFAFQQRQKSLSITSAAITIGVVFFGCGFAALGRLRETHGTDLDYVENTSRG